MVVRMSNSPSIFTPAQLDAYISSNKINIAKHISSGAFERIIQTQWNVPVWLKPKLAKYYQLYWHPEFAAGRMIYDTTVHQDIVYRLFMVDNANLSDLIYQARNTSKQIALSFRQPKDSSIQPVVLIKVAD
jgi:hypothetical protein